MAKDKGSTKGKHLTEKLNETNKAVTTQKVIIHRQLKYNYPRGCKDTVARKAFRQKIRNAMRRMEREIKRLKGEPRKTKKLELVAFKEMHLVQ